MRPSKFAFATAVVALLASGAAWAGYHGGGYHGGYGYRGGYGYGYRGGYGYYGRGYGGASFGFYFGGPGWGWPGYYPYAYAPYSYPYYAPPYAVTAPAPPAYMENQAPGPSSPPATAYWYYCRESQSYYPYVRSCQGNWEPVSPQPPAPH